MNESELATAHCAARAAGTPPLPAAEVARYLGFVPGWQLTEDGKSIRLQRRCEGFLDAVATLEKIAALAEAEDHHPDVRIFSYRQLEVMYSTHSIGGLSENDFIMAAKINRLLGSA